MTTTAQASIAMHAEQAVERNALIIEQAYRAARNRMDVTAVALDRAIASHSFMPTMHTAVRLDAALTSWADAGADLDALGITAFDL